MKVGVTLACRMANETTRMPRAALLSACETTTNSPKTTDAFRTGLRRSGEDHQRNLRTRQTTQNARAGGFAADRTKTGAAPAVLVVDSTADNRAMYAEYLRSSGYRAIEIGDTADALALAVTADIVVTAIRVRGPFDGLELIRRLKADGRTSHKPLIVLTACAFETDERQSHDAGCDVFLRKPCLPSALEKAIRRALSRGVRVRTSRKT